MESFDAYDVELYVRWVKVQFPKVTISYEADEEGIGRIGTSKLTFPKNMDRLPSVHDYCGNLLDSDPRNEVILKELVINDIKEERAWKSEEHYWRSGRMTDPSFFI